MQNSILKHGCLQGQATLLLTITAWGRWEHSTTNKRLFMALPFFPISAFPPLWSHNLISHRLTSHQHNCTNLEYTNATAVCDNVHSPAVLLPANFTTSINHTWRGRLVTSPRRLLGLWYGSVQHNGSVNGRNWVRGGGREACPRWIWRISTTGGPTLTEPFLCWTLFIWQGRHSAS